MAHMQQPLHMTPQQLQFMQHQQQFFLQQQQHFQQQQQQARSSMVFPPQSAPFASSVAVTAPARDRVVGAQSDDFGDFASATAAAATSVLSASQTAAASSVREISFDPPAAVSDDADFGSFESGASDSGLVNTAADDDFEADFQHAAAPTTSNTQSSPVQPTAAGPAVPAAATASMDSLLHSAFDKAFDSHRANAPLVDAPPTAALNAMQPHNSTNTATATAAAIQLHKGRELPSELDDLLNSLLPDAAPHDTPLPTLPFGDRRATLQSEQDTLDFDDFSSATGSTEKSKPVGNGSKTSMASSSNHAAAASLADDDDFADFSSAPANNLTSSGVNTSPSTQPAATADMKAGSRGRGADKASKGTKLTSHSSESADERQIAAAIAAAAKSKGGSFAFSAPAAAFSAATTIVTAIAPPTVAPLSFGPAPPVSIVSLSALVPSPPAASPPFPALFDVPAPSPLPAADDDDDFADFDQPAAAATPFGVGLPSLVGGAGKSQESYFDDEEDDSSSRSSAAQSGELQLSHLQAPHDSPVELSTSSSTSLGGSVSELSGARKSSLSTPSARSTPAPTFDLLDDSTNNHSAPSLSPVPHPLTSPDAAKGAEEDNFAGFTSADSSLTRPSSLAPSSLSVSIPVSPTAIPPPSPLPAIPSPSASLAALSSMFTFPALPSPLPLSLSSQHSSDVSTTPSSALSMLLSQDRFAEWQLLSAHMKATEELPGLQAQYKVAIAASMEDEEQLPVAMALQARIKKLKMLQPHEHWMRPLTLSEQLEGDGSVPSLAYTQLVTLLSAINIQALPAFSAHFPQPFGSALKQSTGSVEDELSSAVQAAAQLHYRANRELRAAIGLLPCHRTLFASRAARVWSHIASQLAAGVAFVHQVAQLQAGSKKDSRLTAALATASSFLSSLAALYRVHLRLALARHTYQLEHVDASASAIEQSWADIKRGMMQGPWKAAADKSHKQLAAVLSQMEVDRAAEWQAVQLTGSTLVDTCELCLGRLDGSVKEQTVQWLAAGGCTVSLHQLCGNLFRNVGLDFGKLNAAA